VIRYARAPRTIVVLSGITALIAITPLVYLVIRVLDAGPAAAALFRLRTLTTTITSIELVVVVVAACLLIGVPVAWLLARANLPFRRTWIVLAALPLAVPSYVAAYTWLAEFPSITGFWAAALVLTLVSVPFVIIPTTAALRSIDPAMEEVARSLGDRPWPAFRAATLPQVWPATAAGALLVGLYVLSDFGAVSIMRVDVFTRVIYTTYRASFDRTSAAVLALVLVLLAAILIAGERRMRGRAARWSTTQGTARSAIDVNLGRGRTAIAISGLVALIVLSLGVPAFSLATRLIEGSSRSLDVSELVTSAINSVGVSALGAVGAVALALPVGVLAARYRSRTSRALETMSYAGHALPGVVVGLALVSFTLLVIPSIYQTVAALALAYVVLFVPKAIGATRTSVDMVPPVLEHTARTLGLGPLRAWMSTTLRLSLPGIAAGGLLVFLVAMKELPATLMLRPTGFDTLATELWGRTEIAAYGAAAPYALALIALAAVPAWLLTRVSERSRSLDQMETV
jgi:iron(III) transport system permease protein